MTERTNILKNIRSYLPWFIVLFIAFTPVHNSMAQGKRKKAARKEKKNSARLDKKMRKDLFVGVKLGLNLASISTDSDDKVLGETSVHPGFGFGLAIDKAFNDYVGIRAEGLWQNKNFSHSSRKNYNLEGSKLDTTTYLDYLEVPIMAVIRFNKGDSIRPFITFGGFFSALIFSDGLQKEKEMATARKPFFAFDGGYVIGAGTYFVLPPGAGFLSLELRYTGGMVNVADNNEEFYNDNTKEDRPDSEKGQELLEESIYSTNNFSFILGYYF